MFRYMGGKFYLAKWIIEHFAEHKCYCEVFGGAGWVLMKKPPSRVGIYNDYDNNIYNIFYCLKYKRQELMRYIRNTIYSRQFLIFYKNKLKTNNFINDVERAFAWLYLLNTSFSGDINANSFSTSKTNTNNIYTMYRNIIKYRNRLQNVTLENLDFREIIKKYDSPDTLFYCDPPYYKVEYYYNSCKNHNSFTEKEHIELADILHNIKGKFLLSYYPCEIVDKYYKDMYIISKEASKFSYGITNCSKLKQKPKATELLIANYMLKNKMF